MRFTYTFRDNTGAISHGEVEAKDRAYAFEQLKKKGVVPLALSRENDRPSTSSSESALRNFPPWTRIFLALIVIVIAVAGVGVWWFRQAEGPKEPVKAHINPIAKQIKPTPKPTLKAEERNDKTKNIAPTVLADFQASYPRKPGHLPLPGGNVVTFEPPKPGTTTEVYTVNGKYLCDSEGNFVKYEPPRLFDNRFENTIEALAMNRTLILSSRTKQFSKDELAMYLSRPITINVDDAPEIVERKTATAAMKEEIREYIQNGGTYEDYVDKLHDRISSERSLHREAIREMVKMLAEGDIESARIYRRRIDSFLSENGYLGLKLPAEWQKQLEAKSDSDAK